MIIDKFPSKLNLQFPDNKISIRSSSLTFKMLLSIISTVFKRVLQMLVKRWQCRKKCFVDSTSRLQEHKGLIQLSKLWLNLCSLRWLKPILSLVRSFRPKESWILEILFGLGRPILSSDLLNLEYDLALRKSGPSLFHSEME